MTFSRILTRSVIFLPAIAVLALTFLPSAHAALLTVTAPGATSRPEGTQNIQLTFKVTNNTADLLLLDYALATITHAADVSDVINFSGAGGSGGLVSAPTFLMPFETGAFTYSVSSPGITMPDDTVPDVNPVTFSTEFSPTTLAMITKAGLPKNIFAAVGRGIFFDLSPLGTVPNGPVLTKLLAFQDPIDGSNPANVPDASLLYAAARKDANNTYTGRAATSVTITDIPEPFTGVLAGSALVLLGLRRRASGVRARP